MAEKKKYPWNKSILNLFRKRINRLENVGGVYAGPPPGDDDEPVLTVYDGPPAGIRDRFRNRFSQLENTGRVYAGPPPREDDDDEPALAVYDGPPVEPDPGQEFPVFPEEEPVIDVYYGPPVDLFEEQEELEEPEEPEALEESEEPAAPETPEEIGRALPSASSHFPYFESVSPRLLPSEKSLPMFCSQVPMRFETFCLSSLGICLIVLSLS